MTRTGTAAVLMAGLLAVIGTACSDDADEGDAVSRDTSTTTTATGRPAGPSAALTPLTAGRGIDLVGINAPDLVAAGYVEEELAAAGTATSYVGDLPADGMFDLEPGPTADYRTRVVVRRPAAAADFNGTVVVEWLNVSAGLDAAPDFAFMADELLRGGYAWVGVSAQRIGVEGGAAAVGVTGAPSGGIKTRDPERYGELVHPGDAFAYDIYTQVARALRDAGEVDALGGLVPERLLAVGESQSAFALTTYVNGVQPLARAFDGFLIHSRGASSAPLGRAGEGVDVAGSLGGPPTRIRTDSDAPVLTLETESDVVGFFGYHRARQPDTDRFRLWEVAGTAHADAYIVGPLADALDCGGQINTGPQHLVVKAALRHLDTWVRTGEAPPPAEPFELDDTSGQTRLVRDGDGIVVGGIRTPLVDVPVATLSGEPHDSPSVICLLLGSTIP
ncbi:MAG: alpha/beta hydrolase domain-containing protein, partial [Acidimicrobiales bacterium]